MAGAPSLGNVMQETAAQMTLTQTETPAAEDVRFLGRQLGIHNTAFIREELPYRSLNLFLRDGDGTIVGGLRGDVVWGWLHVDFLWVDERLRGAGLGTRLMQRAEAEARSLDVDRAHLETTDFQALDFYRKRGYEVFGELPDHPPGYTCYYMKKLGLR